MVGRHGGIGRAIFDSRQVCDFSMSRKTALAFKSILAVSIKLLIALGPSSIVLIMTLTLLRQGLLREFEGV